VHINMANNYKEYFAMGCITVLGIVQLVLYGDGSVLMACVTAISALAGVSVGERIATKREAE
jgi:hypothetical protein